MSAARYLFVFFDLQSRTSTVTISPTPVFFCHEQRAYPPETAPVFFPSAVMKIFLHVTLASRRCAYAARVLIGFVLHHSYEMALLFFPPLPSFKSRTYTRCKNNLCGDFFVGCVACVCLVFFRILGQTVRDWMFMFCLRPVEIQQSVFCVGIHSSFSAFGRERSECLGYRTNKNKTCSEVPPLPCSCVTCSTTEWLGHYLRLELFLYRERKEPREHCRLSGPSKMSSTQNTVVQNIRCIWVTPVECAPFSSSSHVTRRAYLYLAYLYSCT